MTTTGLLGICMGFRRKTSSHSGWRCWLSFDKFLQTEESQISFTFCQQHLCSVNWAMGNEEQESEHLMIQQVGQSRAPGCFPCIVLDEDGHSSCNSCFQGSYQEFILRNSLDLWFACLRTYSMLAQKKRDYQHNSPEGFILDRIVDILWGVSGKWCSR